MKLNSKDIYSNNPFNQISLRNCISEKKITTLGRPSHTHQIGQYIYSELDLLGKGYSSKVYKCTHQSSRTQYYAIKVIDTNKFRPSSLQMLNAQIEIQKSLNHPNLVRCYQSFKISGICYIITQYCQSGDLMTHLQQKKKLDQKNVIEIIKQILAGYKYLIKMGILHRDLKPANVFRSGNTWKIGDFGFAVRQREFRDKINVGTPLYMPLQALMKNKYSVKSDFFALAIIAYQLACGRTPWQCSTQKELIRKMSRVKIEVPSFLKSDMLKQLIGKGGQMQQFKRLNTEQFEKLVNWDDNPQQMRSSIIQSSRNNNGSQSIRCGSPNFNEKFKMRENISINIDVGNLQNIKKSITTYQQNDQYGTTQIKTALKINNKQIPSSQERKTIRKNDTTDYQNIKSQSTTSQENNTNIESNINSNSNNNKVYSSLKVNQYYNQNKTVKNLKNNQYLNLNQNQLNNKFSYSGSKTTNLSLNLQTATPKKNQSQISSAFSSTKRIQNKNSQVKPQPIQQQISEYLPNKSTKLNQRQDSSNYAKKNTSSILSSLQLCRYIYYLMKNIDSLLLPNDHQQNLKMLLFKHLLKFIKILEDRKQNHLRLEQWEAYKGTELFSKISMQIKEYSLRYQREYLQYLKSVDVNTIRVINKNFPELSQQGHCLGVTYYNSLKKYLKLLIRVNNHNIGLALKQNQNKNLNKNIEGLNNLNEFYSMMCKTKSNIDQDLGSVLKPNKLKVTTDYSLSKLDKNYYKQVLRKQLIKI